MRARPQDTGRPAYRGGATTYAEEHRAYARVDRPRRVVAEAVALGLVSTAAVWAALPTISWLWGHALAMLAPAVGADGVRMAVTPIAGGVEVGVPALIIEMAMPSRLLLAGVGFGVLVLWLTTHFLPERTQPLVYLGRAMLLVQASAVVFFWVWPERWPYPLTDYLESVTGAGLAITAAVPVVFALVLHVQDLALWQKVAATGLAVGYSVVLVPLQYAAQAWALAEGTALWTPVLYLFAGVPLHVFALVALYAWAMSWPGRLPALGLPADAVLPPLAAEVPLYAAARQAPTGRIARNPTPAAPAPDAVPGRALDPATLR